MSSKHKARLPSGGLAEDGFSLTKTAMVYAYLIESVYQRQQHYVGITSDLKQRLIEHYEGKSPHTRKFKPWHRVTYTGFADEQTAQAFEKYLKSGSEVGVFDNLLGMVFGFARGGFIVSLAFLLITLMWKEEEYPEWIKGAQTRAYVEKGAMLLTSIAPNYLNDLSSLTNKAKQVGEEAAAGAQGSIEPVTPRQDGYRWMNVDSLQRMIETNVPQQPPAVPANGPQQ